MWLIVVLVVWAVIATYTSYNLLRKNEVQETIIEEQVNYMNSLSSAIQEINTLIDQLDQREVFKADDEVGIFFEYLKAISATLSEYRLSDNYGKNDK